MATVLFAMEAGVKTGTAPGAAERLLKLFPGFLAGGLAFVYVLGAIVTGSEFSGAGIDAREAVPLLSIEQLLARGIGVVVNPTTIVSIGAILIIVSSTAFFQIVGPLGRFGDRRAVIAGIAGVALGMGLALFVYAPLENLPGTVVVAGGVLAGFIVSELPTTPRLRRWKRLLPGLTLLAVVIGLGINAYIAPSPLAEVRLDLSSEYEEAEGSFITHSDSTWYLFNDDSDEIEGFPDQSVEAAFIERPAGGGGAGEKTMFEYTWDQLEKLVP